MVSMFLVCYCILCLRCCVLFLTCDMWYMMT
jgi:hypothetical protein